MNNVLNHGVKAGEDGNQDFELTPLVVDAATNALLVKNVGSVGTLTTAQLSGVAFYAIIVPAQFTMPDIFNGSSPKGFSIHNFNETVGTVMVMSNGTPMLMLPSGALYETPPGVAFAGTVEIHNPNITDVELYLAVWS